jgi:hypothetical protein
LVIEPLYQSIGTNSALCSVIYDNSTPSVACQDLPFKNPVYQEQQFIVTIRKKSEKFQGAPETVAHPLKTPVKCFPGRAFSPLRENLKKIAAPEAEAPAELGVVFGDPAFTPAYSPAGQEEGRRRFPYRLKDRGLLLAFEGADKAADDSQPGEGLADVFFGFLENPPLSSQEVDGKFPPFQDGEQGDNKIKGHIPDRGFSG